VAATVAIIAENNMVLRIIYLLIQTRPKLASWPGLNAEPAIQPQFMGPHFADISSSRAQGLNRPDLSGREGQAAFISHPQRIVALIEEAASARQDRKTMTHKPSQQGIDRRHFLGAAAVTVAASQFVATGAGAAGPPYRVKRIAAGALDVSYAEAGPADGPPVILLHGWPYDIHAFDEVVPILVSRGFRVIAPYLRGYGPTRFLAADTLRNGQPAALAMDTVHLMDALKIERAVLGGFDWGGRTADIVAALWPERVTGLVAVSGYLIGSQAAGKQPLPPEAELQWWYQFYFATERGRQGYEKNAHAFNRLIWKLASPQWKFDDAIFDRTAASFDNPDHVAVVIHNYRWRLGLVDGERQYDAIEQKLAAGPVITVPTITMESDANGAPHPAPASYRAKFTGRYEHRTVTGGIGHNLPQEAPGEFARAIVDIGQA
jgi:pimeloyl-ACP methyl ester carboxylesterase